jgi:hypothetical protein
LKFECTGCGRCCTAHGRYNHVYLNDGEIGALAEYLDLEPAEFLRAHAFVDEDGFTQLRIEAGRCVFLDPLTRHCRVYEARPTQCRTFPFWREWIRKGEWTAEVRALCEGVGRGPTHSLAYARARMREMEESAD